MSHLGQPLDAGYLTHLVRWYLEAVGLGKRGSCHLFRHSVATLMLDNGADIRFIQAILGHAKLETTQIYTRVSIQQLKRVHAATHPAERGRQAEQAPSGTVPAELLDSLAAEAIEEQD